MKLRSKVSQASWNRVSLAVDAAVELREVVFERQILVGDPLLVADRDQALDQVLQLPDVARPPVRRQDLQRRIRDALDRLAELDLVAIRNSRASSGRSSMRSRSGGIRIGMTLMR